MAGGIELQVAIDDAAVKEALATRLPAAITRGMRMGGDAFGLAAVNYARDVKLTGGNPLNVQTGRLRQSIFYQTDVAEKTVTVWAGSRGPVKYARIHEFGGTILAGAKLLTVPLPAYRGRRAPDTPGLFFIRSPRATAHGMRVGLLMARKGRGKNATAEPAFVLMSRIDMPERSYLRSTVAEQRDQLIARFRDELLKSVRGKAGA